MRIGAVLGQDRETIVPLPDGPTAAIVETETGEGTYLPNPALSVRQGRRAAVTRLFIDSGVKAVLAVPGAFCEHSHELARRHGLEFIPVAAGTRLPQVLADPAGYLSQRRPSRPTGMLFVSMGEHHGHHDHAHPRQHRHDDAGGSGGA
ncbi:MAG: hypothetical protein GX496_03985 [Firmicutes bacterium]|nr:hypothetical protein [Bacillota bacterium]